MKKVLVVLGILILVVLIVILAFLYVIRSRTTPGSNAPVAYTMPPTGASINIFDGVLDQKNVSLANPADFEDKVFVSLPELYVSVDTGTLTKAGVKHFREVRVNVAYVNAVRRKDGKYNFEWILHQKKAQKKAEETAKKQKTKVRIDRLHVKFGNIIFKDYTVRGGKPLVIRFDVNMNETYTNIEDLEQLAKKVSKTFLDKIDIGDIRNFEIKDLPDISRSALAAVPDQTKDEVFGPGKNRDRVLKELSKRFMNKIKGMKK
jgi:hypothetical protein